MAPGLPRRCRVLLLEDEPANRALVRAIVARAGPGRFEIREAETLADARVTLASGSFDVILLDVRLPDGNGLDLVAEVRDRYGPLGPMIVVMSASVLPAERTSALSAGVDGFIAKPYGSAELVAALSAACDAGPGASGPGA